MEINCEILIEKRPKLLDIKRKIVKIPLFNSLPHVPFPFHMPLFPSLLPLLP